ncbi:cyclodeaminase/cyclohydrolase family protein [Patescibacteria group bacterium]|nr:cyclodeaminase/cyclohydrolase family protein [Patescibacteria group bacterium]MBU2633125.1 cyclodeaminase/cyclohydrolase family protein [Patescibacteria group bacterium]
MKQIKKQTIEYFLKNLSSKTPAPGGGSVSALMGACSASLVSMVCNLTIGKKKYIGAEKEMKKILKKADKLRDGFLILAEEDKKAFLGVIKNKYSKASLKKAMAVPAKTARLAGEVLKLAKVVLKKGNRNAITDAKIAIDLAKLAKRGATLNVEANC